MHETCLALIPARGGSKGIPNKNIAPVGGRPLICWTIDAARNARSIARALVTTDSKEIAEISKRHGAELPFLRPKELAEDDTPGIAPLLHALRWLEDHEGYKPSHVVCLQPTSPLRTADDIDAAMDLCRRKVADAVVGLTVAEHPPEWMKRLDAEGRPVAVLSEGSGKPRRQDLPPTYVLNGAIYLARRDVLLDRETWYTDRTYGYVMPRERSLDIDTPWDLYLADLILSNRKPHERR